MSSDLATAGGWTWPLTVPSGEIVCAGANQLVFRTEDGTEYALNGLAKSAGYRPIDSIWLDDPDLDGLKVDMSHLTDYAIDTCGY